MQHSAPIDSIDFAQTQTEHVSEPGASEPLYTSPQRLQNWDFSLLQQFLDSPSQAPLDLPNEVSNIEVHTQHLPKDGIQLSTAHLNAVQPAQKRFESTTDDSGTETSTIVLRKAKVIANPQHTPNTKSNLTSSKVSGTKSIQQNHVNLSVKRGKINPAQVASAVNGRDKVERDVAYRLKLLRHFPEDRLSIARNIALKPYPGSKPLHIFIDYSNMFIGYQTYLQRRSLNAVTIGRQPRLCIESLIFLLERGRAVDRRHLAGSKPWQSAFAIAERAGYSCTILEKVAKPIVTTGDNNRSRGRPRSADLQKKQSWHPDETANPAQYGSSPEKSAMRYVEQGVDEILQLKMSLSIIDLKRLDQKTMVLATGDGAEAEYSDGFASMVERALDDDWSVELVSWEHCTSSVYKQKQWLAQWAPGQFRFIALDPFVDELQECQ